MALSVSEMFGNHMVLQRGKAVPVWGTTEKNTEVTVSFQGQTVQTCSDMDGKWNVRLAPLAVSQGEDMVIETRKETVVFRNVAVGEVWLAGGQSNMEFFMRYDKDFNKEVQHCENPNVRYFGYPVISTDKVAERKDYSDFGFWRMSTPEDLQYFSAVGYYCARDLQKELNVPVGIIGCNCGGSRACCWMDEETVQECGPVWMEEYLEGLKTIQDPEKMEEEYLHNPFTDKAKPFENPIGDKMMYGIPKEELLAAFSNMEGEESGTLIGPWHEWRPSGLYHRMVEHVAPYAVRGVLWYQGESDDTHPEIYAKMMTGVIDCWRKLWGEELPFIFAQLAPFGTFIEPGGKYYPILREQQAIVAKEKSQVWMVPTGDVGSDYDIHPKEKQPVGVRMALAARGHVYGESILCDAPALSSAEHRDQTVKITLAHTEGGLHLEGDKIEALEVFVGGDCLGSDSYTAQIKDGRMVLQAEAFGTGKPIEVRFAKTPYYKVNLYNAAHIPVLPFAFTIA